MELFLNRLGDTSCPLVVRETLEGCMVQMYDVASRGVLKGTNSKA